jgi:hypothetical protein
MNNATIAVTLSEASRKSLEWFRAIRLGCAVLLVLPGVSLAHAIIRVNISNLRVILEHL